MSTAPPRGEAQLSEFDTPSRQSNGREQGRQGPILAALPRVLGALYPQRLWRTSDSQTLVAIAVVTLIICGIIVAIAGASGTFLLAAVVVVAVTVIALVNHRRLLWTLEQERRQTQALASLHAILPLRAPLPPMAGWACTPELAAVIASEILANKPRHVFEVGSGVSTIVACYCLEKLGRGRLTALDHDADFALHTRLQLARHGFSDMARVIDAPLRPMSISGTSWSWYDDAGASTGADSGNATPDEPDIDLLVVDGPPLRSHRLARYPALPRLWSRLSAQAVIILDDARRPDERAIVERWLSEYPQLRAEFVDNAKGIVILRRIDEALPDSSDNGAANGAHSPNS